MQVKHIKAYKQAILLSQYSQLQVTIQAYKRTLQYV